MNTVHAETGPSWLNKVPEVTLIFWIVKIMSTTVGETAADYLAFNIGVGLTGTSALVGLLFAVALFFQIRARRYVPALYWLCVVLISVFGTLITDNLTDRLGVPLAASTGFFSVALIATFAAWYALEETLSVHAINTVRRELFYWLAILFTFALGTAVGDWVAEGLGLGYVNAGLLFGGLVAATAVACYGFKANAIVCFWIAYILTRPFGASCGDLLSQPANNGGLGFGMTWPSIVFLSTIVATVSYMTIAQATVRVQRSRAIASNIDRNPTNK